MKEFTESGTTTYYVVGKVVPFGEGRVVLSYEAIGLTVSDKGEGLFHNATQRILGGMTMDKGVYKDERGSGVWTLENGDQAFFTYTLAGETKPGGGGFGKGTCTFVGGTGKCTGIKGSFDVTRYVVRTSAEGIGHSYSKAKIKYTLS
jgi:hypothetical protein